MDSAQLGEEMREAEKFSSQCLGARGRKWHIQRSRECKKAAAQNERMGDRVKMRNSINVVMETGMDLKSKTRM